MIAPFQDKPPATQGRHDGDADQIPCAICGRPVRIRERTLWLHVVRGGRRFEYAGEGIDEYEDPGSLGWFPVGSRCARKYRIDVAQLEQRKGELL